MIMEDNFVIQRNIEIWLPIFLITVAETLIYFNHLEAGVAVHGLNLVFLAVMSAYVDDRALQALILLPLFRCLNVAIPTFFNLTLYSYALVYLIMLPPIFLIIKSRKYSHKELGFNMRNLPLYLFLGTTIGLLLGWIEYQVLKPPLLIPSVNAFYVLQLAVVMILLVGFVEEFIFRSTLQTSLVERFGLIPGLMLASIVFGMMHSGYHLPGELLFVSIAGLVFGILFLWTHSFPLIVVAHGVTNISLFLITPLNPSIILAVLYLISAMFFTGATWWRLGQPEKLSI